MYRQRWKQGMVDNGPGKCSRISSSVSPIDSAAAPIIASVRPDAHTRMHLNEDPAKKATVKNTAIIRSVSEIYNGDPKSRLCLESTY